MRLANQELESGDITIEIKHGECIGTIGERNFLLQKADLRAFELKQILHSTSTDYQQIVVGETDRFGRVLVLDGDIQSSENDERLYHEALVQPAMLAHEQPVDILIIGTGEGATIREIRRHNQDANITAVDIDRQVVEICAEQLPSWHDGLMFHDSVRHYFEDGFKFLRETESKFDVAIIDIVSDWAEGPAEKLYSPEFYQLVKNCLKPSGIVGLQSMMLSHIPYENAGHRMLKDSLTKVFSQVHSYSVFVPSFFASWSFMLVSDWFDPASVDARFFDDRISARIGGSGLTHFDGEFIKSRFCHCKKTRESIMQK